MSNKKINQSATTKLSALLENDKEIKIKTDKTGIIVSKKLKFYPSSFRLTASDIDNLKRITLNVNKHSQYEVSATKVLRALLLMGTRVLSEEILDVVRELI